MDAVLNRHEALDLEARALLTRLARVKPFVLNEPMLLAASLLPRAQLGIERFLAVGRRDLRSRIEGYRDWLCGEGQGVDPDRAHHRLVHLRLQFNAVLSQLDLFSQVISQRSESDNGVWMAGLDVVSADALALPTYYQAPPVVCYLDRGIGAAIRRARTRLPGGGENPVAVIRVPRERMVGSGIASSLVHEVGHQASALLDLVNDFRGVLRERIAQESDPEVWTLWERWISEVLADVWSIARVGVASTMGLIGVVGLPRPFVFRVDLDDPHPIPWIRVRLSAAIGQALYPDPQWQRLSEQWLGYYPVEGLDEGRRDLLQRLEASMPDFIALLLDHRPAVLQGRSLPDVLEIDSRQPAQLRDLYRHWLARPSELYRASPCLVFAVLGQVKADGALSPEDESALLSKLLGHWAMRSALMTQTQMPK